jgi:hypothetical protein
MRLGLGAGSLAGMEAQMIVDESQSPNSVPWPPLILAIAMVASLGLGLLSLYLSGAISGYGLQGSSLRPLASHSIYAPF